MQCPRCEHENKAGRKFCSKCGTPLENVCPKCGCKNDPDDEFCGECGTKLGETISSVQPVATVPTLEKIHSESRN